MNTVRQGPAGEEYLGAGREMRRLIRTHLFGIAPNESGSSFLLQALATCRNAWSLPREGQKVLGYFGPALGRSRGLEGAHKIWASRRQWRNALTDPRSYDWPRTRRAWYFQARARDPRASVFVTKSPPHLLLADELVHHFDNARFLFMVRNPYAVCEGIVRIASKYVVLPPDIDIEDAAARHVVACFRYQRRNIERHRGRGVFFTYETMCVEPERVARRIRGLVPELDDLELRQRLRIKERRDGYDEMLTDMNARHIARLDPRQIEAFNRVFGNHRDLLGHFGYPLLDADR